MTEEQSSNNIVEFRKGGESILPNELVTPSEDNSAERMLALDVLNTEELSKVEMRIMLLLSDDVKRYGLEIKELTGIKKGSIYVTLNRMVEKGLLDSEIWDTPEVNKKAGMDRPRYFIPEMMKKRFSTWVRILTTLGKTLMEQ